MELHISDCSFTETEIKKCLCGCACTILLRKDLLEMEAAAQSFEQEDEILKEVQAQMLLGDDSLQSTLFACTEVDGYRPYCKIETSTGNQEVKGNLEHLDPISQRKRPRSTPQEFLDSAGFTLPSLGSDEMPLQNVWFRVYLCVFIFDVKNSFRL